MKLMVLGDPVAHSLSPVIHRAGLAAVGIKGTYEAVTVDDRGMRDAVDRIRRGSIDGANVTMPHKQLACQLADELGAMAARTGAVNTLFRRDGVVVGQNTDVAGVEVAWRRTGLPEGPVLVLGAGGAAAAAVLAVTGFGFEVVVSARRPDAARALLRRVGVVGSTLPWGTPLADAVVVNATPIGMHGEELPASVVERALGLFEMAYASGDTPAIAHVRGRGLPVATGPEMLLAQAMASFLLWTGVDPPEDPMRRALYEEIERRRSR